MERQSREGRQLCRGSSSQLLDAWLSSIAGQRRLLARRLCQRCRASKKNYVPDDVEFRTKPQIALTQIERALSNRICVSAWTFDEFYGRDGHFLDGLESLGQLFVGEIPSNFHGWAKKPTVIKNRPKNRGKGKSKSTPYVAVHCPSSKVSNLLKHSPVFRKQAWQRYRIKDTDKGPCVWEIKWARIWRKDENNLPTRRHCLIVARNVLTGEVKYFLSNRVPGDKHPVTGKYISLRGLLRVAFGRWSIESCFRQSKEELGMDHYQVRGWRCLHRHFYVTQLSHLFCARVRQEYDDATTDGPDRISVEQVRSATDVWLDAVDLTPSARNARYEAEIRKQAYYQRRNKQARKSHTKTKVKKLKDKGIDPDKIKSCIQI